VCALCALAVADAQSPSTYPDRPVRLVVPFPAGGGADNLARAIAPKAAQFLGQPIVIENKPGAGGNIGAAEVARAAPDGYTILHGTNGTHGINQALYAKPGFDPFRDFAPIARWTMLPAMVVVHPSIAANNVDELVAYLKANPNKVSFGSAGNGTTSHLAGTLFRQRTGADIVHVPYKGGGPALAGLLAGDVQLMVELMVSVYPQVKAGKLKGLAVTTKQRVPTAPDFPTLDESGVPGFDLAATDGVYAPAGTLQPIVDKLNAAFRQALDDPQVKANLNGARRVRRTRNARRSRRAHRTRISDVGEGDEGFGREARLNRAPIEHGEPTTMTDVCKGQAPPSLSREAFRERFEQSFDDPAYDAEREAIGRLETIAWHAYSDGRKAPRTSKAGLGFADPDYELSDQWRAARERLLATDARMRDASTPSCALVIAGADRNDGSCPGEMSKTFRLACIVREVLQASNVSTDLLDLSLIISDYRRRIHPCKGCASTAMPLCHWPCSCDPNHAMNQVGDWMAEIYERWVRAHGVVIVTPTYWTSRRARSS
jgi:tripartite-type tricarboxylate transporter receptor subunit TctC